MSSYSHEKHLSLHKLVVATMIMSSPTHSRHNSLDPLRQAGGGTAASVVPLEHLSLSNDIQEHLKRVYQSLCSDNAPSVLSREEFVLFFAETQGQDGQLPEDKLEYSFEEFLWYIFENRAFSPILEGSLETKDLSYPITSYFISSSHNTYLEGNQLSSRSSTEAYKNVLRRGCRCIEIDVWNGDIPESNASSSLSLSNPRSSLANTVNRLAQTADVKVDTIVHKFLERSSGHVRQSSKEAIIEGLLQNVTGTFSDKFRIESVPPLKPEPQVLHGRTLTSAISFRDVCRTIKETGFETSPLPIIVSLEVHADWEQQQIMVDIMKEEWAGLLIDQAEERFNPDEQLPTLGDLQGKILVKVKRALRQKLPETVSTNNSLVVTNTNDPETSGQSASEDERGGKKKGKSGICEALSALGIYTHSAHFESFEQPEAKKPPHIFSISESKILDLHQSKRLEMFTHNRNFFMRAYPAGFRIDSSNLDPSAFWRKGVQMAALNWQTLDECMMLNEAMFAGEYGWVLKPPGYRSRAIGEPSNEEIQRKTLDFCITIYAAQHIPLPGGVDLEDFHPYVKCVLHVEQPEDRNGEPNPPAITSSPAIRDTLEHLKQRTSRRRGDHPDWGEFGESLEFSEIPNVVEELSFVRLKVYHEEKFGMDSTAAWACFRLDRLRQGYRFVNLLDTKGRATAGFLLVKIKKVLR